MDELTMHLWPKKLFTESDLYNTIGNMVLYESPPEQFTDFLSIPDNLMYSNSKWFMDKTHLRGTPYVLGISFDTAWRTSEEMLEDMLMIQQYSVVIPVGNIQLVNGGMARAMLVAAKYLGDPDHMMSFRANKQVTNGITMPYQSVLWFDDDIVTHAPLLALLPLDTAEFFMTYAD